METAKPVLSQAKEFAEGVRKVWPEKWLAYNLSPSFNWDAAGLSTQQMQDYIWELGKLGFVWQFITVSICSSKHQCTKLTLLWEFLARWLAFKCLHFGQVCQGLRKGGHEGLCRARAKKGARTKDRCVS